MQINNHEKVLRALDLVRKALVPYVDSRLGQEHKRIWAQERSRYRQPRQWKRDELDLLDCLKAMDRFWREAFQSPGMDRAQRGYVHELIEARNRVAHQRESNGFSDEDTTRTVDTAERLLRSIGSTEADAVRVLWKPAPTSPPQAAVQSHSAVRGTFESLYIADVLGDGLTMRASPRGLRSVQFTNTEHSLRPGPIVRQAEKEMREYLNGTRDSFDVPLDIEGTAFQRQVWNALRKIPYGETRNYAEIATEIGKPGGHSGRWSG